MHQIEMQVLYLVCSPVASVDVTATVHKHSFWYQNIVPQICTVLTTLKEIYQSPIID
jgi:hypothetical protein